MWRQAFRPTAAILSALMLCSAPALAGTVRFADVTSGGPARSAGDVRLRVASAAGQDTASQQGPAAAQVSGQQPAGSEPSTAPGGATTASGDGTLTQSGAGQVETVDLGDVTGTVCDCGVIPDTFRPSGGFPWWPLLGGAIVPFLFRGGDDDITPINPEPTPTPPPPAIPEPATLLLFGTGLLAVGARARRRLAGKQALAQTGAAEEV